MILLEGMSVYTMQNSVSDEIWERVTKWDYFARKTLGDQLVRAFDSIGANIAEGYGRYHTGDKIKFYYYARGSAFESQYWIKRARERQLLTEKDSFTYLLHIQKINQELNQLIKSYKWKKDNS